jgi:hypothetical protein
VLEMPAVQLQLLRVFRFAQSAGGSRRIVRLSSAYPLFESFRV